MLCRSWRRETQGHLASTKNSAYKWSTFQADCCFLIDTSSWEISFIVYMSHCKCCFWIWLTCREIAIVLEMVVLYVSLWILINYFRLVLFDWSRRITLRAWLTRWKIAWVTFIDHISIFERNAISFDWQVKQSLLWFKVKMTDSFCLWLRTWRQPREPLVIKSTQLKLKL